MKKTNVEQRIVIEEKDKLNCGAERHHYSMFNVERSMFDVHLFY